MSDNRKKPLWPWIVALLIGLPVLYVASFGPACGLVEHELLPRSILRGLPYKPCLLLSINLPRPISGVAQECICFCDGGWEWGCAIADEKLRVPRP